MTQTTPQTFFTLTSLCRQKMTTVSNVSFFHGRKTNTSLEFHQSSVRNELGIIIVSRLEWYFYSSPELFFALSFRWIRGGKCGTQAKDFFFVCSFVLLTGNSDRIWRQQLLGPEIVPLFILFVFGRLKVIIIDA